MTFCIAIEKELTTEHCPLLPGRCYWAHRVTRACTYTDQELTPEEFALRVGSTPPSADEVQTFTANLRTEMIRK